MKVGPKIFSIQQVVSSSVELLMCIFIVLFFRRLHAKRTEMNQESKEAEALKCDDEVKEIEEEKETEKEKEEKEEIDINDNTDETQ